MSFLLSSPEVNSALMYAGAGPTPMLAAAAAWEGLADELGSAARSFSSLISDLVASSWQGPSARAMTAVAMPYAEWLGGAATQAGGTATGARAMTTVYETARAAVVHPVEIAINRNRLVSLALSNIFGLNAPAIAAEEFEYEEMWAKDVAAMVDYHCGASTVAEQLVPWQNALKALPGQVGAATGLEAATLPPAPAATAIEYALIASLIGVNAITALPVVAGLQTTVSNVGAVLVTASRAATTAATSAVATANVAIAPLAQSPVFAAATAAVAPVFSQVTSTVNGLTAGVTQAATAVLDQAGKTIGVVQNAALASQLGLLAGDPALLSQFVSGAIGNPALLNSLVPVLASNPALVTNIFGLLASNPQLVTSLVAQVQANPALAAQLFGAFAQLQASNPALAAQLVSLATQLANQLGIGQPA